MILREPPVAGTVLRYGYLWKREADAGQREGKDRPVALVVGKRANDGECVVVPITHADPNDPALAIEIPDAERRRLGLDSERAWIVLAEFNAFFWPGHDLRPVSGRKPATVIYGRLSRGLYTRVLTRMKALLAARKVAGTPRT